jgi:winged helix DNA-binding protein
MKAVLVLSREQILAFRRRVSSLDRRLPAGAASLRTAAWAGLQDSMPRAALLSIHARVEGAHPESWADEGLVQVWGPRYSAYAVPARDHAYFTLGRYPDDERGRRRAEDAAKRVHELLEGRRLGHHDIGEGLGVNPNSLKYATTTGTVLIRWEGARQPTVWTVPRPDIDPFDARLELARRYLHVFGPTTGVKFADWAGIGAAQGQAAFEALVNKDELTAVATPIGEGRLLSSDEPEVRAKAHVPAPARLIPSGDTYFLCWGTDRELLVGDPKHRAELWTSRVWPGAVLVGGDVVGTWRRANANVSIQPWRRLSPAEKEAVEAEGTGLPLPALPGPIRISWET